MKHKFINLIAVVVIAAFTWQGQFAYSEGGQVGVQNRKRYKACLRTRAFAERRTATRLSAVARFTQMRFPQYDTLVRLHMPNFPDGWDPKVEDVFRKSGPPVVIWGPGVEVEQRVLERMTQILKETAEARARTKIAEFEQQLRASGERVSRQEMEGARQQIRRASLQAVTNSIRGITIKVVKSDPVNSPALILDFNNQECLFSDYNPAGKIFTMREDAFWNLSLAELEDLFYRLIVVFETSNSPAFAHIRTMEPYQIYSTVLQLIAQLDKQSMDTFPLDPDGCTPLTGCVYRELLPSYYNLQPSSTILVNTAEITPVSMEAISLVTGAAPGMLHVVSLVVQNAQDRACLVAASSWETQPSARDVYGRSHVVDLSPGRFIQLTGGSFRNILATLRLKANVYCDELGVVHSPEMVRYFGGGAPSFMIGIDNFGRVIQVPHPGQPLGSMRLNGILNEGDMSRKFWDAGFLVAYPLGYVARNSPEFLFDGEPTGALLQAMPINAGRRLHKEFDFLLHKITALYRKNNIRAGEQQFKALGDLVENFAKYLRNIHSAGFIHGYPHTNNFSLVDWQRYLFMTHDLDNAREKKNMTLDEAMARQINDVGIAFVSLVSSLGEGNIDVYNRRAQRQGEPSLQQIFLRGYFGERLANQLDPRYQSASVLRNFVYGEPAQRPISQIDDSLIHVMRQVLEPEHLSPLHITRVQLQNAPPNPVRHLVSCEIGINELTRLWEAALAFGVVVISEEAKDVKNLGQDTMVIPISNAVQELAKGDQASNYLPFIGPNGFRLVSRGSSLHVQMVQAEEQIQAWQGQGGAQPASAPVAERITETLLSEFDI